MEKDVRVTSPRYQQIAADIAVKIASGHYKQGEKIYARSSLASQYGVSAETARRAICVLSDMQIVDSTKGSGVVIASVENARRFIQQYQDTGTVRELRRDLLKSVERQYQELETLKEQIGALIDKTERFRSLNPFVPFELVVSGETPHLGKTASDLNFWHNTAATIIAIRRGQTLILSPGPYSSFQAEDVIYFIGDECCLERVKDFLYPVQ